MNFKIFAIGVSLILSDVALASSYKYESIKTDLHPSFEEALAEYLKKCEEKKREFEVVREHISKTTCMDPEEVFHAEKFQLEGGLMVTFKSSLDFYEGRITSFFFKDQNSAMTDWKRKCESFKDQYKDTKRIIHLTCGEPRKDEFVSYYQYLSQSKIIYFVSRSHCYCRKEEFPKDFFRYNLMVQDLAKNSFKNTGNYPTLAQCEDALDSRPLCNLD